MKQSPFRLSKLSLGLMAALIAAPAFAQSTSSGISGVVTDASGAPVSGAEVTIVHVESGTVSHASTDASGYYSARGLRPGGPYTIKVSKGGTTQSEEGVYLELNSVASVNERLGGEATSLGTISVTGNRAVLDKFNSDNKGLSTNISGRALSTAPAGHRSLDDIARLDPRISVTDGSDGSISMAGLPNRYNNISVDGLSQGDPFGLNSNGMPYTGSPISPDTIAAYNISTTDFDVGSDTVGANINAVTKSGTNEFHGSVYGAYKDAGSMVGSYPNGGGDYTGFDKDTTYGFTLGGPIIKDKLFFFVSAEKEKITKLGTPANTGLTTGKVTQAELDAVEAAAENWGLQAGSPVSSGQDLDDKRYLAKLDWNIADGQRASFTYQRTEETKPTPYDQTDSSVVYSSHWYNVDSTTDNAALEWYGDWTDSFSTEAKVSYQKFDQVAGNALNQPHIQILTPEGGTIYLGEDQYRHENEIHTKKITGTLDGIWRAGDHTVKFGFDYQRNQVGDLFGRRLHGFYVFNSPTDFANGTYITASGSNQAQRTLIPAGETLSDIAGTWTYTQISPFIQDAWQVTDNFSLTYGVRVDIPDADHAPPLLPEPYLTAFETRTGFANNSTLDSSDKVIEPRVGFNWLIDSENLLQVRGGAGLFQTVPPVVWLTDPYLNNGSTSLITSVVTAPFATVVGDDSNQNASGSVTGSRQIDAITPDFKLPTAIKASLAVDAALPFWSLIGSVEYQYIKAKDAIWYTEPFAGTAKGTLPDGRISYWSGALGTGANNGTAATGITYNSTVLGNTDHGASNSLTFSLTKPVDQYGFSGNFSVTFSHATEVNPGNSSQANSNYQVAMVNPNDESAYTAGRNVAKSVKLSANWDHAFFGDYRTTVSLYYNGHDGLPYSWVYGSATGILGDVNGDGQSGYDLAYIPTVNDSKVQYNYGNAAATQAQIDAFNAFINSDDYLRTHRGEIASRNASHAPWSNELDIGFQQELPGFHKGNKFVVRLDIDNFLNLLNRDWGDTEAVSASSGAFNARRNLAYVSGFTADGKYIYDLSKTPTALTTYYMNSTTGIATRPLSLWSALLTLKYQF